MSTKILNLQESAAFAMAADLVPLFWGPPGEAKTAILEKFREHGFHIEILLGSVRQPYDYLGYPAKTKTDGEDSMTFYPPDWAVRIDKLQKEGKKSILLFDEMTTAAPAVQNAMLRVINERQVCDGKITFERGLVFPMAAANKKHHASGFDLTVAMKNRFIHIDVNTNDEWLAWARGNAPAQPIVYRSPAEIAVTTLMPHVADFVEANPEYYNQAEIVGKRTDIQAWASKRTWTYCARILATAKANRLKNTEVLHFLFGAVGDAPANSFLQHMKAANLFAINLEKIKKDVQAWLASISEAGLIDFMLSGGDISNSYTTTSDCNVQLVFYWGIIWDILKGDSMHDVVYREKDILFNVDGYLVEESRHIKGAFVTMPTALREALMSGRIPKGGGPAPLPSDLPPDDTTRQKKGPPIPTPPPFNPAPVPKKKACATFNLPYNTARDVVNGANISYQADRRAYEIFLTEKSYKIIEDYTGKQAYNISRSAANGAVWHIAKEDFNTSPVDLETLAPVMTSAYNGTVLNKSGREMIQTFGNWIASSLYNKSIQNTNP